MTVGGKVYVCEKHGRLQKIRQKGVKNVQPKMIHFIAAIGATESTRYEIRNTVLILF